MTRSRTTREARQVYAEAHEVEDSCTLMDAVVSPDQRAGRKRPADYSFRSRSGSLAILAAMSRASSRVSRLAGGAPVCPNC